MKSLMDLTDGWLTDWGEEGGLFKEWVRDLHLQAINHGWGYAITREPYRIVRRFCENVAHVISWVPVLWADRDWDHVFLWVIMREKLKRMRLLQEQHGNGANRLKTAQEIRVAEMLLTRLIEDKYTEKDIDEHYQKFPRQSRFLEGEGDGVWSSIPMGKEEAEDISRVADKEWALKKRDAELLGRWMAAKWWGWWD